MVVFGGTQLLLSGRDHIEGSRVAGERDGEGERGKSERSYRGRERIRGKALLEERME